MEIFAISGLVNALAAVSFGVLVLSKNWRERQNQIFFLMTAALAIWGFSYWRWLSSDDSETALFWVRMLAVGSVFIPVFFLDWVTILLRFGKKHRDFVALTYLGSVAVSAFALTEYFIAGIEPKLWFTFWPNSGWLYTVYFLTLYTGVILWSVITLYRELKKETDALRKGQILYVFWGAVLGFGGGLTNFFLWFNIPIPPYGNFLVAAFPFLLGYSVLKYKLFNVRTIATELIAFALFMFTVIITFLAESTLLKVVYGFFAVLMGIGGVMLIKAVYKTEKLSEEKSEFMSFATHQVKKPLADVKSASSMLLAGDFGQLSDEVRDVIRGMFHAVNDAVPMVQAFLISSKLEQDGGMKYQMEQFDLRKVAEEVAREEKFAADEKGLALSFSAEESGGEFFIKGDALKLKQVILNLVDNAIKYTATGNISVALKKQGGKITLSVRDSGVGIPKEEMSKLFKKFSHANGAAKVNVASNGLGLYLAAEFVKAHNGRIWAESEGAGKGTTFFVELPTN